MDLTPPPPWPEYTVGTERSLVELVRSGDVFDYGRKAPIADLEDRFSRLHEAAHVVSFGSGTSALFALFAALNIGPADEVLVPNLTFLASASPLLWLGATPVLVDSGENGAGVSVDSIASAVTPRTKALVVTHLFGNPVDVQAIAKFARERGLLLIEDCSHAHASTAGGRHVGLFGDGAIYSIGAGKMISGGHGGLLVTRDSRIRDLALLVGHFKPRTRGDIINPELRGYAEFALGGNLRLSPLAAVLALDHLVRLEEIVVARKRNVAILDEVFGRDLHPVRATAGRVNRSHFDIVYQLPTGLGTGSRDELMRRLQAVGIPATAPATRPLNRVLNTIARTPAAAGNAFIQRLNDFAASTPDDSAFPHSTGQHDRMISLPARLLYRPDLEYAKQIARAAEPVLRSHFGGNH